MSVLSDLGITYFRNLEVNIINVNLCVYDCVSLLNWHLSTSVLYNTRITAVPIYKVFIMSFSGVVYYVSLLVCISLGSYYKKIVDIDVKRNYGTGLGLLLVCLICGTHVIHSILMVWGNIIIIKCCDRRLVVLLSSP